MSTLEKYKTFWKEWQVQLCIMCSLLLQIFLFFFASFRKKNSRFAEVIKSLIWLAYLLADVMATYSLALISNTIGNPKGKIMDTTYEDKYNDLLAFWAPFLLIHLGGPDSITAHALEDNELWLRHSLYLVARLFACGYIFVRSFPNHTLIIPTLLLLVAGTIKYLERTMSLYYASNQGFKKSVSEENDQQPRMKRLEDFIQNPSPLSSQNSNQEVGVSPSISIPMPDESPSEDSTERTGPEGKNETLLVYTAFQFLKDMKGIITGGVPSESLKQRMADCLKEHEHEPEYVFTMMDIELSFLYDIYYTKTTLVHPSEGKWIVTRPICFFSILGAFFYFILLHPQDIQQVDLVFTYLLLGGALMLEVVSIVMLIFSPWTFLSLEKKYDTLRKVVYDYISRHRKQNYISQFNMIDSCLWYHQQPGWMSKRYLHEFITKLRIKFIDSKANVDKDLMKFFLDTLKGIGEDDLPEGGLSFQVLGCPEIRWALQLELQESIVLWHIATDLLLSRKNHKEEDPKVERCRLVSKVISEYLAYLLVLHPSTIIPAENRPIIYETAYKEAMRLIKEGNIGSKESFYMKLQRLHEISRTTMDYVIFEPCFLVQSLEEKTEIEKWETISQVWVHLLMYAATHCRPKYHAQGLIRGGEFITYSWFLMVKMGLGKHFHGEPHGAFQRTT